MADDGDLPSPDAASHLKGLLGAAGSMVMVASRLVRPGLYFAASSGLGGLFEVMELFWLASGFRCARGIAKTTTWMKEGCLSVSVFQIRQRQRSEAKKREKQKMSSEGSVHPRHPAVKVMKVRTSQT
ncbi:hypothetical protein CLCR_06433 [Cladophialophora carrionii]|uniref:Uncharacterized protein n=1 Tax=Cladophialophora carrionii TaxID=86049 RepID=A0A1C1C992_9EURO|nr:hypothetical protein CLCR_06433 [Cladophialophora carrionii]